ncbi:MAG: hypothetical protein JSU75_09685 [Gammaproteobacteria bacterium]|nr:MAG: hypothetical protein JSU75_09685 [Gammaproteobacteria bacterium]
MRPHWLLRHGTIRLLWIVFACVLLLTVLAGLVMDVHGYFGIDGTFAFNAWYGFVTCVGMVVIAKLIGRFLHRKDSYYDRD